jgi:hypothetical protein
MMALMTYIVADMPPRQRDAADRPSTLRQWILG